MAKRLDPRTHARYRRARRAYLALHPYCEACKAKGIVMPSAELDHIVPLADGGPLWGESNWQALCEACHDEKTTCENTGRRARDIPGQAAWRKRLNQLCEGKSHDR